MITLYKRLFLVHCLVMYAFYIVVGKILIHEDLTIALSQLSDS